MLTDRSYMKAVYLFDLFLILDLHKMFFLPSPLEQLSSHCSGCRRRTAALRLLTAFLRSIKLIMQANESEQEQKL